MAESDDLSFFHRKDRPLKDGKDTRDYLIGLIDQLLEIEASSHPSAGPCPNKDDLSREAIQLAGRVLECSIGWAIDHQVGLVLNTAPSEAPPLFDDRAASPPGDANDHLHEATAPEYSRMADDLQIEKRMLWSLLILLPHSLITGKLWVRVLSELHFLDMGEVSEFFLPSKLGRGKKKSTTKRCFLQLKAMEHLEFLRGNGDGWRGAVEKVIDAYCLNDAQLLVQWNNRLPKDHIDKELFEAIKRRARKRGESLLKARINAKNLQKPLDQGADILVATEVEALRIHGAAYMKLEGRPD